MNFAVTLRDWPGRLPTGASLLPPLLTAPISTLGTGHHSASFSHLSGTVAAAMSMEESISLEETNKIRISLGLKPLTDDSTPANDKEKEAEQNYAKQREAAAKAKETKYVSSRTTPRRPRTDQLLCMQGDPGQDS